MFVVVAGNLSDGFMVVGPFDDRDEAMVEMEDSDLEAWVMTLTPPKDANVAQEALQRVAEVKAPQHEPEF